MAGIVDAVGCDAYTTITKRFNSLILGAVGSGAIGAFGRNGTSGLRLAGSATGAVGARAALTLGVNLATGYVAFAFKTNAFAVTATPNTRFLELRDNGAVQVYFEYLPSGVIRVYRGDGTVLGTTTFAFALNIFYHFEVEAVIDNSAGEVNLRINGAPLTGFTGLDTNQSGNAFFNEVVLCNVSGGSGAGALIDLDFDDLIIRDDDFCGDCRVREDLPTGTGSIDDGVPTGAADSRQAVDDSSPDDDTTRAALEGVGDKILLTYATIPTTSEVVALLHAPYAAKSDAGTAAFKGLLRIGGVNYLGAEKFPSNGSYAYHPQVLMVSPATAAQFTAAEVNGLEMGVERTQ